MVTTLQTLALIVVMHVAFLDQIRRCSLSSEWSIAQYAGEPARHLIK